MTENTSTSAWHPGVGLGFRVEHAKDPPLVPALDFVEVHAENYVGRDGHYRKVLASLVETNTPILVHGLTLGLMNRVPFEKAYLRQLRDFLRYVRAPWYSDHLCMTASTEGYFHDLLPGSFTCASLACVIERARELEDALELPILFENASTYASPPESDPRAELSFVLDCLAETRANMLLDVNNVFVNASNHGFSSAEYVAAIPADRIRELHVAGHELRADGLRIDTHAEDVLPDVHALLRDTIARIGPRPVLLERDGNIPTHIGLQHELERTLRAYREGIQLRGSL